jgi:hypothetical protein
MKYLKLFSLSNLALLNDWLEENGELLVDIYRPHSGGGGFQYFVYSLEELKYLIKIETWEELAITIFQEKQYSLRGIADEAMLKKALSQVKNGDWYSIISLERNLPNPIDFLYASDTHSEMKEDFSKIFGQEIGFGQNPFDIYDDNWFKENNDKVFTLTVTKSRNYNESYVENPEKYKWLKKVWEED